MYHTVLASTLAYWPVMLNYKGCSKPYVLKYGRNVIKLLTLSTKLGYTDVESTVFWTVYVLSNVLKKISAIIFWSIVDGVLIP